MTPERALTDVNLSEIQFTPSTSDVVLDFLNMSDGNNTGTLVCRGVIAFLYHAPVDVSLPVYIGQVDIARLSGDDADTLLKRLGRDSWDGEEALSGEIDYVRAEGWCVVEIACLAAKVVQRTDR